jgi:alkaline phosphatase D
MKTKLLILSLIALIFQFVGISALAQTVEVTIPDMYDTTGAKIVVPIMVSDVTGLEINAYSFTLLVDQKVLKPSGFLPGSLGPGWATFISDQTDKIIVASAGVDTLEGSGDLVSLIFDVVGKPGDRTTLAFESFMFNEGTPPANTQGGVFSIPKVTHGPVCGAVTSTSARFVVRTDFPTQVQMFLSQDSLNWTNTISSQINMTLEVNENFVLIDVKNLTPNTTYFYAAHLAGQQNPGFIGKFKTFPAVGEAAEIKFLFGSCQQALYDDPKSGFGNIFPLMAQEQPNFFLHQGDWIYPDTTDSEQGDSLNFFAKHIDLIYENYRDRYDPLFPMAEMLKVTPVDFVWDDHDWVNNNCDGTYMNEGGTNSIEIYQKAFPHYPLPSASNGIWHKFTCGNTDVFMVDNRVQRDPNLNALYWHPTLNRFVFVANYMDNHSILGDEQMNWLLDELKNSKATWKFISSGTPFNPAGRGLIELTLLLQGTAFDPFADPATGSPLSMAFLAEEFSDKWAGFPSDVYKLLSGIINNNIENVIFLSGDTHNSGIDDGTNSILPELMGGPLDRTNQQLSAISKEAFKINIWNKGGHTYDNAIPPDLGNAYGKVSVFGADSVKLDVVSETGKTLATHSVKAGFLPRPVAGIVVPGAIDFGVVKIGDQGGSAAIAISTSIDTLKIADIIVTPVTGSGQVIPVEKTGNLASGESKVFLFGFVPMGNVGDTTLAAITFVCNDPAGFKTIYAQGVNGLPVSVEQRDDSSLPLVHHLYQNYPNPFNPTTTIKFSVPERGHSELYIINLMGQRIRTLMNSELKAGYHEMVWDGKNDQGIDVTSGVYFIALKSGDVMKLRKITLIK